MDKNLCQGLANTETFADFEPKTLHAIVDSSSTLTLNADQYLFRAGDDYKKALYILCDGRVKLYRANGDIVELEPGSFLGLSNYIDSTAYSSSVQATTNCTILVLAADVLTQLESKHPSLSNAFNHIIAERIRARSFFAGSTLGGALASPVRSAMKSPLSVCEGNISLRDSFKLMQERKIGSIGVNDSNGILLGVLTYSGLAEALAIKNLIPDQSVMQAACETPHKISPNAPLWQAEETLHRYGVKYLIVTDHGKPIGVISQSDILNALIAQRSTFLDRAASAVDLNALHSLYNNLYKAAREARESNRLASRAVTLISEIHWAIQKRCVQLTIDELKLIQAGSAPRGFAVLIMGSGGRQEMLLNPDQDNGIIIDDGASPLSADEEQWFSTFADHLNINLDRIGYVLCPGDIMARNPMFRKTLSQWKQQIDHMMAYPNQKAARWSNIVFDFSTLYGDDKLTYALRKHLLQQLERRQSLLGFMVEDDAEGRPPLGWFNQLQTTSKGEYKDTIDIKRNGLRLVADAARIYALSAGIRSSNTLDRLNGLVRQGVLSSELVDSAIAAYEVMLTILLRHQIKRHEQHLTADKYIKPDDLTDTNQAALRVAMRAVRRLQDQLQGHFGRSAF